MIRHVISSYEPQRQLLSVDLARAQSLISVYVRMLRAGDQIEQQSYRRMSPGRATGDVGLDRGGFEFLGTSSRLPYRASRTYHKA